MQKTRDLVGLPVVDLTEGETVGEVRDVLFAPDMTLHSVLLEKPGLMSAAKIVPIARLHAIGRDSVTIESRACIEEFRDESGLIRSLLEGTVKFVGRDVLTHGGEFLGRIEDVYVGPDLRTIIGYEVSEGFLVDLREGRKVLHAHPEIMVGADALLVPEGLTLAEEP